MISERCMAKRVGLIGISLPGERTDIALDACQRAHAALTGLGFAVIGDREQLALNERDVLDRVHALAAAEVSAIVYLLGTWLEAPMVVNPIERTPGIPVLLWAIPALPSFSLVAAGVVKGALDDLGRTYGFVYGDPDDAPTRREIRSYLEAGAAIVGLRRSRLGILGGRSLGMYTSTVDEMEYKAVFGTEIEHVDQLRLVAEARALPQAEVDESVAELHRLYKAFAAPPETLERSIRLLLSLARIVEEERFDFLGVKCLSEVINYYTSCCLAVSLLNDRGIPTACQADIPAAFVMKILSDLSGGACAFADVAHVDCATGLARLVNCGTMPTTLAALLRDISWGWQYEYMGRERGVTPIFSCRAGQVTICCLSRVRGKLTLLAAGGAAEELAACRSGGGARYLGAGLRAVGCRSPCLYRPVTLQSCDHGVWRSARHAARRLRFTGHTSGDPAGSRGTGPTSRVGVRQ